MRRAELGTAGSGGFEGGFVDEHDGDVVFYRVDAMALCALQAFGVLAVVERLLAGGADQNVEERFRKHGRYFTRDRIESEIASEDRWLGERLFGRAKKAFNRKGAKGSQRPVR